MKEGIFPTQTQYFHRIKLSLSSMVALAKQRSGYNDVIYDAGSRARLSPWVDS